MSEHRTAATPGRPSGSQFIQWGLIGIPVSVYTGTEDGATVRRKQFTADGHSIGSKSYDKTTGDDVAFADIVKMAQAVTGDFVALTDEEIEAATTDGPIRGLAEIIVRAPASALGTTYVVTKTDQVRAARRQIGTKKVDDPAAQKAFALLTRSLRDADEIAIVRVASHSGAKNVAITADGGWLTLAYAEQIRGGLPLPEVTFTADELALARRLLDTVPLDTPVLTDTGGARVQAYVDAKAAGEPAKVLAEVETGPVINLMAALEASLLTATANRTRPDCDQKRAA